jgi:hypothetical protein
MKIPKERYNEIINALDGIRCDNRENKQYSENENDLRDITQDTMQYIERKGYCKYIYGANCRFVRTLTEKGYEVLQYMDYGAYRRQKSIDNRKSWMPIVFSGIAILVSIGVASNLNKHNIETEQKVIRLDSSINSLKDSINSLNLRMTKEQSSTKHFLDSLISASKFKL